MACGRNTAIPQPDGILILMIFVVVDNQCAAFAVKIRPTHSAEYAFSQQTVKGSTNQAALDRAFR